MKLKLLLPFAVCLACTAIGQQPELPAGQAPPKQPPRRAVRLFIFPGGTPVEFLAAVDKEMGSHLSEVATIPEGANRLRVPQVRAKLGSADDAITLFDSIADTNGGIGRWIMQKTRSATPGADDDVLSLVFVPPPMRTAQTGLDVRAVSLRDIPESKWKAFTEMLHETLDQQAEMQKELTGAPAPPFKVKIYPETGVLVASGGKEFKMDQVETLAQAMRTSFAARPETGDDGVKARAFSIAGLSQDTVSNLIDEMTSRSNELRHRQEKLAEQSGAPVGAGAFIVGKPDPVERLQVLVVAGNSAGLEFARSLIEEVKSALDMGPMKFVVVDGAVRTPGTIRWTSNLTVLDAITATGDLKQNNGDDIRLTRDGTTRILRVKEMKLDPNKNIRLQPGDHLEAGNWPSSPEPKSASPALPEKP